ncbi:MAG: hypothetical protein ACKV2U_01015 [Bryobacteraceae bacterium]
MRENRRFSYLLPAVAMMLGWGLRGFIGGGPFGAMIPGAMVALALCWLYPRRDVAMLAAFAAIGVGFGGEMTYGQTVGFIVKADTFWWGLLGLALKGAIWGALAGAVIGMAFTPRPMLMLGGGAVMAFATWVGWKLINEPKVIYFSNPLDRPRPEIWAGFLLAALALVGYLGWRGKMQPAARFAIAGFVGGGIGFGGGGAIQGLGRIFTPELNLHWWKYMEFFFGFCFGWALAWAWAHSALPEDESAPAAGPAVGLEMAAAAVLAAGLFWLSWNLPVRFGYLLAGSAVLYLLTKYRWAAKHIACTVTFTAVALDLARYWSREYKRGAPEPAYALAIMASIIFGWYVIRWSSDTRRTLELLMWACVVDATVKFGIHPNGIANVVDHVAIGFILMAAAVSWMLRKTEGEPKSDAPAGLYHSVLMK